MPDGDHKYISSTEGKNCLRMPIVIYADFECLLYRIDSCEKYPDKSYTEKRSLHVPCGYSITTCYSYDKTLNKSSYYRGTDCVEKFSQDVKEILNKHIYFEEKPMLPLTDDEQMLYSHEKSCYLCEKEFCIDKKSSDYKNYCKVRDHDHFTGKCGGAANSKCNLKYKVPKVIPVVFHNGSIYYNHLIIKQISNGFNGYFKCTGENTEKYITFSMNVAKKDTNTKKKRPETYTLRFIDSYMFMSSSLDNLVKNLAEPFKNLPIDVLKQRFLNTYQLCDNNIDKFKLLLRKVVYPYEHMDSWEKFKLPVPLDKKLYYSETNDRDINDNNVEHIKNVCATFNINNLAEYHDLYVQSDTALLADVFENFRDKCLAIDKLDPAYFLSAPGLSFYQRSGLKMTQQTLELLTDENMLLLFEKGVGGGICEAVTKYKKANNKYMKNYDSTKPSSYLMYVDANN